MTAAQVPFVTSVILFIGIAITAFEDLRLRRDLFDDNLFDWRYCLAFQPKLRPARRAVGYDLLLGATAFRVSCVTRVAGAGAAVLLFHYAPQYAVAGVAVSVAGYLYLFYRFPYSLDGADQMCLFVLIGVLVMSLDDGSGAYLRLGAATISAHAAISYLTSGGAKLISPIWRSGRAVVGVMSCAEFGNGGVAAFLWPRPRLGFALAWLVIAGHLFVGLSILIGGPLVYPAAAVATAFHLSIAALMRLNMFVWSFGATLPPVIYFSDWSTRLAFAADVQAALGV